MIFQKDLFIERGIPGWLEAFKTKVVAQQATIISFNWDLVLERLLFGEKLCPANYVFTTETARLKYPILLKPHGSLNWYEEEGSHISESKKRILFRDPEEVVYLFLPYRAPISYKREYNPLIVPPAFLKNFKKPIFQEIWNKSIEAIAAQMKLSSSDARFRMLTFRQNLFCVVDFIGKRIRKKMLGQSKSPL